MTAFTSNGHIVLACVFAIASLAHHSSAQTLRSSDGRSLQLPTQFVVEVDGIRFVPRGAREPLLLDWGRIDLVALAQEEPQIEEARHTALLTKTNTHFTITPPIDYVQAFLELPVDVTFNPQWEVKARGTQYHTSAGHFPQVPGLYDRCLHVGYITNSRLNVSVVNRTRYPIATTIEGILSIISQDGRSEVSQLIRDLRAHDAFFPNLAVGLRKIHEANPTDLQVERALRAIERLSNDVALSVDAQRHLADFLRYARWRRQQSISK